MRYINNNFPSLQASTLPTKKLPKKMLYSHMLSSAIAFVMIASLTCTIFAGAHPIVSYSRMLPKDAPKCNTTVTQIPSTTDVFLENSDNYVEGQVIVQTDDSFAAKTTLKEEQKTSELTVEQLYDTSDSTYAVLSSDTKSTKELITSLQDQDGILAVEPNHIYHPTSISNDSYSDLQWYLKDDQASNADIDYDSSLLPKDSTTPVIVVMDSAIDVTHEDLKDAMYTTAIYNAVSNAEGSSKPTNDYTHGTHIAGIIAATTNNSLGISGTSNAKLLSVQIMKDTNGEIETNDMILLNAYQHIIDLKKNKHVNICAINLSIGGDMDTPGILNNAITEAGKLGIITVCATGNEHTNIDRTPSYPASLDNDYIISVGASNRENKVAGFSNYGATNTDVFAPGCDIFSTYSTTVYNPEIAECLEQNYFYEDFSEYDLSQIYSNSSDSSVMLDAKDHVDYNQSNPSSLAWTISATAGQTYGIAIPYEMEQSMKKGMMGLRLKVKNQNNDYWKRVGTFIVTLDQSQKNFTSDVSQLDNGKRYSNFLTDADSWVLVNSSISSDTSMYTTAGDEHYLKLIFIAAVTDNITIAIDNFGFSNQTSNYAYDTGTSMATPIVAGEIGLLQSIYPNATAEEIIGRVLGGVDISSDYDGYCITSGRVNLAKAITNPGVTIAKVTQQQNKIILSGYRFGSSPGTVTLKKGTNIYHPSTIQWDDRQITIDATELDSGYYDLTITCSNKSTAQYHSSWNYTGYIKCTSLSLNKSSLTLFPGEQFTLKATSVPANAITDLTFTSSDNSVVTVTPKGLLIANHAANKKSAIITCYADSSKKVFDTCKVTVAQKALKLKLNKTKVTIKAGRFVKLKATVSPKTTVNKKVKWTSSNKKYATVNSKGKVKTKKAGKKHTVTITCKTTDGSKLKKTCKIKIK